MLNEMEHNEIDEFTKINMVEQIKQWPELVIALTGYRGSGKSLFLTYLCIDFACKTGMPVLSVSTTLYPDDTESRALLLTSRAKK